jgi:hypothetical protein
MTIAKRDFLELVGNLPDEIDLDEIIYRLYLKQKLEDAEQDIRNGNVISHDDVIKETEEWFRR